MLCCFDCFRIFAKSCGYRIAPKGFARLKCYEKNYVAAKRKGNFSGALQCFEGTLYAVVMMFR